MKLLDLIAALAVAALPFVPVASAQVSTSATTPVVVRQAVAPDPGHAPIPVVIWAPASGTGLPLIVISHGTGAGPVAHIDTARALAEAGFVVVAPMHPGDNFQDDSSVGKPNWFVDRSRHVRRVIDYMLADWEGHDRLAPEQIGIFGFSAGATTALIAIGGEPDLSLIAPHCAAAPEFVCKILGSQASAEPPVWTHDPRITAAVIAAPGIGFAFDRSALAKVAVPVQLWSGGADDTVPYASNTAIVREALPNPVEFHSVDGAMHLSFLAPCTAETPPFLCQDKPGFDRAAFHRSFNASVIGFFEQKLKARSI